MHTPKFIVRVLMSFWGASSESSVRSFCEPLEELACQILDLLSEAKNYQAECQLLVEEAYSLAYCTRAILKSRTPPETLKKLVAAVLCYMHDVKALFHFINGSFNHNFESMLRSMTMEDIIQIHRKRLAVTLLKMELNSNTMIRHDYEKTLRSVHALLSERDSALAQLRQKPMLFTVAQCDGESCQHCGPEGDNEEVSSTHVGNELLESKSEKKFEASTPQAEGKSSGTQVEDNINAMESNSTACDAA